MPALINADLVYYFRRSKQVIKSVEPDVEVLAAIEQDLLHAADEFRRRRYLTAIQDYEDARELIWSQLAPVRWLDETRVGAMSLMNPLVSLGTEGLNVLPIE